MHKNGWRPFWAALGAALLVLLPLVGGTVLLSRQQLRTQLRQAARSESGVPIQLPVGQEDTFKGIIDLIDMVSPH